MSLRPYQQRAADRLWASMQIAPSLAVAPTGAGKSWILGDVAARAIKQGGRGLVLHHREELVAQNRDAFRRLNPGIPTAVWKSGNKRFADDGVTFAMVSTLTQPQDLASMPPIDALLADECDLYLAPTYHRVIQRAQVLNPALLLAGVTATPFRSDKKKLGSVFPRVADIITTGELIAGGFLSPPRAMVMDVSAAVSGRIDALAAKAAAERREVTDQETDEALNVEVVNSAVVEAWKAHAEGRTTIAFCSTVEHSRAVCEAFNAAGISARSVDGKTKKADRKRLLAAFDQRKFTVLVNVGVATTGFDVQHVGCVILLRPSSFKRTLIQMIGRGLRVIDEKRYPGLPPKIDCLVLDFGRSLKKYGGDLAELIDLDDNHQSDTKVGGLTKPCPACKAIIPLSTRECPLCGTVLTRPTVAEPDSFMVEQASMRPIDIILDRSPFRWVDLNDRCVAASGMSAWTAVFADRAGLWSCYVGRNNNGRSGEPELAARGSRTRCVAAGDDFLREFGDLTASAKSRNWLARAPSDKQLALFGARIQPGDDRYIASCRITLAQARDAIRRLMTEQQAQARA